jgi:hypothetical protein
MTAARGIAAIGVAFVRSSYGRMSHEIDHVGGWGVVGLAAIGGRAEASVVIDISQVGSDVVATGGGTIDLMGLTFLGSGLEGAGVIPKFAAVLFGAGADFDLYKGLSGPPSFGTGDLTSASSASLLIGCYWPGLPAPWVAMSFL